MICNAGFLVSPPRSLRAIVPHLKLPPWYQRRPRFRDELVRRLLNIDPQTGAFRQNIVALVGLPGSGKSSMILEVLEQVQPFFQGGILYGDQAQQSPKNILMDWLRAFDQQSRLGALSLPILAERLEQAMKSRGGRYLLIIENIDGRWLHELRIPQRWLLVTTYGLPPLQPLGWEPYMVPIPAFRERDTIALLKQRLDGFWDRRSRVMARWLHRFVEGLPMAVAILAAVIRCAGMDLYVWGAFEIANEPYHQYTMDTAGQHPLRWPRRLIYPWTIYPGKRRSCWKCSAISPLGRAYRWKSWSNYRTMKAWRVLAWMSRQPCMN